MRMEKMSRAERALHSLQIEFMQDAEPGEWYELPGGELEGQRIPDHTDENGNQFIGCVITRPISPP